MILVAAAALLLAACGGPGSPAVAHLGRSATSGGSATTQPTQNPTQLLDEWAACMRSHGDPGQVDPSIDVHKVIHIIWNPAVPGGYNGTHKGGQGNEGPGQYCRSYLNAAQNALRGGPVQPRDPAKVERFSQCMRANGIPDFPDPGANGTLSISMNAGGDLNPHNPTFQNASRLCSQKTGVPGFGGTPPSGTVELNGGLPGSGAGG